MEYITVTTHAGHPQKHKSETLIDDWVSRPRLTCEIRSINQSAAAFDFMTRRAKDGWRKKDSAGPAPSISGHRGH